MRFLIIAVVVLAARTALACGGLFCSQVSPTPVDQRAERILFEVLDDGTVSATVEIRYEGDPRAFSWIVPVSGTPEFVDVAPKDALQLLDAATTPRITPPTGICSNPPMSFGFGCAMDAAAFPRAAAAEGEGEGGVNAQAYPSVGPFDEIVVVDGNDPGVLMAWLNEHGYQVTDAMRPFIEQYTVEGYKFLATKLESNADVKDMVPIRFHCPQPFPEIPLRLTAIAAEPDMGFTVFVAGAQRYTPSNYAEVALAASDIQTVGGTTNYFALVSKRIDEAGGLGFVVERAQSSGAIRASLDNAFIDGSEDEVLARAVLEDVLERRPYVTRFYARMSADEMIVDPQFAPGAGADFDGNFDLSDRTVDNCPGDGDPDPITAPPTCGTLYCGDGDACAGTDAGDGCLCRLSHVARVANSPTGGLQVACVSLDIDVHGSGANVCAGQQCGAGTCLPVNDRPACKCDDGNVGVLVDGRVRCEPMVTPAFESDQILWPTPVLTAPGGCAAPTGNRAGGLASIALLFASAFVVRRVLRRRD